MSRKAFCVLAVTGVLLSWPVSSAMAQLTVCTPNVPLVCGPQGPAGQCGCDFLDDFEQHALGEVSVTPITFDWHGWAMATSVLGEVTTEQNHSAVGDRSLAIDSNDDTVRRFLGEGVLLDQIGYDQDVSDCWVLLAWSFVPLSHTGDSFLITNSDFDDGATDPTWHTQIRYSGTDGVVEENTGGVAGNTLPLIQGQWMLYEVQMNFREAENSAIIFYGGDLLDAYNYTDAGGQGSTWPANAFHGNLDLFNSSGSRVYWDDIEFKQMPCPTIKLPEVECVGQVAQDTNGCSEKIWRFTNNNLDDAVDEFYLDVESGAGGRNALCVGAEGSISAVVPPAGWTVINCQKWTLGHVLFKFTANTPADVILPGLQVSGTLIVDPNKSAETVTSTGVTMPPFSIRLQVAQKLGNEVALETACTTGGFGPTVGGQKWGAAEFCASFLPVPSTTAWAKIVLALALMFGGTILVVRSRRSVVA